jgi:secondary thiamine-phosphate synthase enzyme
MIELSVSTKARNDFVEITDKIRDIVKKEGWTDGVLYIHIPHTTAGITINEHADPSVVHDIITQLDKKIPWRDGYDHSEGNSAAHIKCSLTGSSTYIFIENGRLLLGTWQGVFFAEFDGPRNRKVWLKFISGKV